MEKYDLFLSVLFAGAAGVAFAKWLVHIADKHNELTDNEEK